MLMCSLMLAATPAFATGWEGQMQRPTGAREIGALDETMTTTVAAPRARAGRHQRQQAARHRSRQHAVGMPSHRQPAPWGAATRRHGAAANAYASADAQVATGFGGGGGLVSEARRYLGGNPTGRSSLWRLGSHEGPFDRIQHLSRESSR